VKLGRGFGHRCSDRGHCDQLAVLFHGKPAASRLPDIHFFPESTRDDE
jgi:hypothetical protein